MLPTSSGASGINRPTPAPTPTAPAAPPELKVAPSVDFEGGLDSVKFQAAETLRLIQAPGDALNLSSGKKFREARLTLDAKVPYQGVHGQSGLTPSAQDVPNPDSPDGKWDPYAIMPRFVFDKAEDAFPVAPDFDGDTDLQNNGHSSGTAKDGNYKDGVIGGEQPLNGSFNVTKKGEYTIATYSFYYATNKGGHYHENDYSTAQVYMKPGKDGKLEPTHLFTSWHHGAMLTPWKDLQMDDQGRPMVKVNKGTHALEAYAKGDKPDPEGLQIAGDGRAELNGKPTDHKLSFETFQTNVKGAEYLDPKDPASKPRLSAMQWGEAAMNPFLPELFEDAPPAWRHFVDRGVNEAEKFIDEKVDQGVDFVKDKTGDVVDTLDDAKDKVVDVADDAKDTVVDLASDGADAAAKGWDKLTGFL
jgi:hypothetical protein